MRELSLADGPAITAGSDSEIPDIAIATEPEASDEVHLVQSPSWGPSSEQAVQMHTEPNFLPPFASEENKAINRKIQVRSRNLLGYCLWAKGIPTCEVARQSMRPSSHAELGAKP